MLFCALGALAYHTHSQTVLLKTDTTFDASSCTALSGNDVDTVWCKASCGAIANPACPESFCQCEGEMPTSMDADLTAQQEQANKRVEERDAAIASRDASVNEATQARDASIAQRDDDINSRIGGAASDRDAEIVARDADINSRTPAGTMPSPSPIAGVPPVAVAPVPVAVQAPAPVADPVPAASPGPQLDWATGAELPQAPSAEYDAPVAAPVPDVPATAAVPYPEAQPSWKKLARHKEIFDALTCESLSGKEQDTKWCKASCGMESAACPSSFCKCEGEMPGDIDTGPVQEPAPEAAGARPLTPEEQERAAQVADRDAQIASRDADVGAGARDDVVAQRDADIANRAPAADSGNTLSDRDAEIAQRDADINSRTPAIAATNAAGLEPIPSPAPGLVPAAAEIVPAAAAPVAVAPVAVAPVALAPVAVVPAVVAPAAVTSPVAVIDAAPTDWATGFELPMAPSAAEYNAPVVAEVPATIVQTPVVAEEYNAPVAPVVEAVAPVAVPVAPIVSR